MEYIYNIKTKEKISKIYDIDYLKNKDEYDILSICIIITDILNIKSLFNINYFLIDHENINNLNMINEILKLKNKTIFLYSGFCDL